MGGLQAFRVPFAETDPFSALNWGYGDMLELCAWTLLVFLVGVIGPLVLMRT